MKNYRNLCLMTLKSDAKFEEKLTLGSTGMSNLVSFNACSGNSEDLRFYVLLLSIAYKVSAKKLQKKLSLIPLKKDPKFEEKLTLFFEKLHEKFGQFLSKQWKA